MKYKKVIILLLLCSIVLNIIQLYNTRKYREVFNHSVQTNITDIFAASQEVETILFNISKSGETTNLQLEELLERYNKLVGNIMSLGNIANIYNSKNEILWNFLPYIDVYEDLNILTSKYEAKEPNSIIKLSNDEIKWLKKLLQNIDDIRDIGNKYSYIEGDMHYYRLDMWIDIYRELTQVFNLA